MNGGLGLLSRPEYQFYSPALPKTPHLPFPAVWVVAGEFAVAAPVQPMRGTGNLAMQVADVLDTSLIEGVL